VSTGGTDNLRRVYSHARGNGDCRMIERWNPSDGRLPAAVTAMHFERGVRDW
jgi:hypothetical protein